MYKGFHPFNSFPTALPRIPHWSLNSKVWIMGVFKFSESHCLALVNPKYEPLSTDQALVNMFDQDKIQKLDGVKVPVQPAYSWDFVCYPTYDHVATWAAIWDIQQSQTWGLVLLPGWTVCRNLVHSHGRFGEIIFLSRFTYHLINQEFMRKDSWNTLPLYVWKSGFEPWSVWLQMHMFVLHSYTLLWQCDI